MLRHAGSKAIIFKTPAAAVAAGLDFSLIDASTLGADRIANAAALLWQGLEDINWCGFYLMDHGALMLGPFCGLPACIRIPVGRGVCGTAVAEDKVQLVYNVHDFPGHIACDSASNSEIVLPIHVNGEIWGVLDIDSPFVGRFTEADKAGLEKVVERLERVL